MFLSILNGGFKKNYSKDDKINNYLKLLEKEVVKIQEYFIQKINDILKKIIITWVKIYQESF